MATTPNFNGLTTDQVAERILLGQANKHKFDTSRNIRTILRSNILTLFNGVIGVAFALLLMLGKWQDALFGIPVIANVLIGIVQEYRSKVILDRLSLIGHKPLRVRRDSKSIEIAKEELVVDDVLELAAGDQLPVDAKVISSNNLEIDESLLSGEVEPVAKEVGAELLSSSIVTGGSGLAQVTKVGAATYASKLLVEARSFTRVSSEIRDALDKIIRWISWALGPLILIVLFGQLSNTKNLLDALVRAIASVISMVPQGLVLITSIAFAIAATRLARGKVLMQELAAVEGLARVNLICFDKTGTLTSGRFEFDQAIELFSPESRSAPELTNWRAVLAEFAHQPSANATARALRTAFPTSGLGCDEFVDFSSEKKYSSITVAGITWSLGAPEMLTANPDHLEKAKLLASQGLRVLLLTMSKPELVPVVIVALREEINPQASQTLAFFKEQQVQVKVISGDHPRTVATVARNAGLEFAGEGFDARELPTDLAKLREVMEQEQVFGRVAPEQKKLMVALLQKMGNAVAMVGDGVNDALAIKQADIGIAMGSGSAATRAVANLTLLDDNFDRLPKVVAEGRQVIANIERLSRLFLTKTTWAMILALAFGVLLWEFPFLPRQLSAVDGFAIGIPAFFLAFLPNQQRYQAGFLKRALMFCVPAGIVTAVGVLILAVIVHWLGDWSAGAVQTATSVFLSITGLWVLGTLSRPWSPPKLVILLTMIGIAVGMFLLPITTSFFGFSYLSQSQLILTFGLGLSAGVLIELVNLLASRGLKNR